MHQVLSSSVVIIVGRMVEKGYAFNEREKQSVDNIIRMLHHHHHRHVKLLWKAKRARVVEGLA